MPDTAEATEGAQDTLTYQGHDDPNQQDAPVDQEVAGYQDLLGLAGVDEEGRSIGERHLIRVIARLAHLGVPAAELGDAGQAYIRALGRITAAEVEIISTSTAGLAPEDRADGTDALLDAALEVGRDTFEVLHDHMLRRALARTQPGERHETSTRSFAIAHVDVVGSTAFLERATAEQTQRLVDGLFTSAQSAILGRSVDVIKYAGDGVFFVGAHPTDVARASLDCIESLLAGFDLNARAGLAFGPVIRRAGDVFGLPVNLSHILTKSARPGTLLASEKAAETLPESMRGAARRLDNPALSTPLAAFEILPDQRDAI